VHARDSLNDPKNMLSGGVAAAMGERSRPCGIGLRQKGHRTVWLKSGRELLMLKEARRSIKKEAIHE